MASIESFRPYIEDAIASTRDDEFIVDEPTVRELTPTELANHLRGYVSLFLVAVALILAGKMAFALWQQYQRENVSPITKMAPDRASFQQQRHKKLP